MSDYPCYDNWIKQKKEQIILDTSQDSEGWETTSEQISDKHGTYTKNGILYDHGVAIDYSDSDRDYDY